MPLKLIVGPPNSGRAGEVRRRLDSALDREPVLVVPTGDDAAWFERELCAGERPSLGVSIRTFGWLFEDVAAALALDAGPTLTGPQRLALLRAAISTTELRRLHRSAQRPGFAPALDSLIEELQAALISPSELAERSRELDDGAHEAELAELYGAYVALRQRSGRTDRGALADAALAALGANPSAWASARSSSTASTTSPSPSASWSPRWRERSRSRSRSTTPTGARSRRGRRWSASCATSSGPRSTWSSFRRPPTPCAGRCSISTAACSRPRPARSIRTRAWS